MPAPTQVVQFIREPTQVVDAAPPAAPAPAPAPAEPVAVDVAAPAETATPAEPAPAEPTPAEPASLAGPATPAETAPAETAPAETAPAEPASEPATVSGPDTDPVLAAVAALGTQVSDLTEAAAEIARLRTRDTDLIARLHEDVTRLRNGEIAIALNPIVAGMIKLHDQMVSLGALTDPASPVAMLYTQLLQLLELSCAVEPYNPAAGDRFDAARHTGVRRIPASDPAADGTIATTIKTGFARADGSVVRPAEVEVYRLSG